MAPPTNEGAVVLFDGVCNLCNGWVRFVIQRDTARRFRFASLQSAFAHGTLGEHGFPRDYLGSMFLFEDGVLYAKSDAFLRIARHLGGAWPFIAVFAVVPRTLRDAIYDWVARNRYRWFGRSESCMVPRKEDAVRFLV
jgi:predicted DCC family thiol-disulfide oxidoreductase YuxK